MTSEELRTTTGSGSGTGKKASSKNIQVSVAAPSLASWPFSLLCEFRRDQQRWSLSDLTMSCSSINAAYTFIGIECVAIAAAESTNPSRHVPKAIRRVVWRILFFYIFGVLIVGMIVSANNPLLTSDTGDANSSPFVIAIRDAGIPVLPSFINACILTSAWSAGNAYLWTASRTLVGMSIDRQAPQIFSRVNRWGVPYYSVGFTR